MLSDVLKEEYIKLNVEVSNWEEAIKEAGTVLKDNGVVNEQILMKIKNSLVKLNYLM